jgi:hypothetical protein
MRKIILKDGTIKKVHDLKRTKLKRSVNPIKKVSKKQGKKNRELMKIKKTLDVMCYFPCCYEDATDLMHILPKSIYPEYSKKPENLIKGCRFHHDLFDNNIQFRKEQLNLYNQIKPFAPLEADRYFNF